MIDAEASQLPTEACVIAPLKFTSNISPQLIGESSVRHVLRRPRHYLNLAKRKIDICYGIYITKSPLNSHYLYIQL